MSERNPTDLIAARTDQWTSLAIPRSGEIPRPQTKRGKLGFQAAEFQRELDRIAQEIDAFRERIRLEASKQ